MDNSVIICDSPSPLHSANTSNCKMRKKENSVSNDLINLSCDTDGNNSLVDYESPLSHFKTKSKKRPLRTLNNSNESPRLKKRQKTKQSKFSPSVIGNSCTLQDSVIIVSDSEGQSDSEDRTRCSQSHIASYSKRMGRTIDQNDSDIIILDCLIDQKKETQTVADELQETTQSSSKGAKNAFKLENSLNNKEVNGNGCTSSRDIVPQRKRHLTHKEISSWVSQIDLVRQNHETAPTDLRDNTTVEDLTPTWVSIGNEKTSCVDSQPSQPSSEKKLNWIVVDTKGDYSNMECLKDEGPSSREYKRQSKKLEHKRKDGIKGKTKASTMTDVSNNEAASALSSNITSDNSQEPPKPQGRLREIVIDGCNIAMAHANGKSFSEKGLEIVIDYFKSRGHTVRAFVPQYKRSSQRNTLEKLYLDGIVVFTPSRRIGGRTISSYDDRFILDYATMCEGIIVTSDQYRDLYTEKPEWKDTIENRLLAPTFVGDYVMFPEDPLGRYGPKLDEFLRH